MGTITGGMHHLETEIGTDLFRLLLDPANTAAVRTFAQGLLDKELAKCLPTFFDSDEESVRALVDAGCYDEAEAQRIVAVWRRLATVHKYKGPILWRQPAGFTLRVHASKTGSCHEDFSFLQGWDFEDTPTSGSLVFWVPRILRHSTDKTAENQLKFLHSARGRYQLPEHHLQSFGTASQQAALTLAHFKRTGERTPLEKFWIRTDTRGSARGRLALGDFDGDGLDCDIWSGDACDNLGIFPLGMEILGS